MTTTHTPPIPPSPRLPIVVYSWLPVLIWAWLIFYLSDIPNLRITYAWYDLVLRKIAHMFVFGVLAILVQRAFSASTAWPAKKIARVSLVATLLYACSDEYHQTFVQGRAGTVIDVGIDTLGAYIALWTRRS